MVNCCLRRHHGDTGNFACHEGSPCPAYSSAATAGVQFEPSVGEVHIAQSPVLPLQPFLVLVACRHDVDDAAGIGRVHLTVTRLYDR